jgi:RHS repeat-associated protein
VVNDEWISTGVSNGLIGRYYDPVTAQFVSVDPAVAVTGEPYGFAGDDPANESDPSGLGGGGWNPATLAYARSHTCGVDGKPCESAWHSVVHCFDAINGALENVDSLLNALEQANWVQELGETLAQMQEVIDSNPSETETVVIILILLVAG